MRVVLFEPQIPQNTGNIMRTCVCMETELVLCGKTGFALTEKHLRRAHLDYGVPERFSCIPDLIEFLEQLTTPFVFFTTKTKRPYSEVSYQSDHTLIFGAETHGLPQEVHDRFPEHAVTIPMGPNARSLNLSVSVGIGLAEAWRQCGFSF